MMARRASLAAISSAVGIGVGASTAPPGAASCSGCHAAGAASARRCRRSTGAPAAEIVAGDAGLPLRRSAPATVMDRIAKGFSDDEIQAIAAWFAAQR